MTQYLKWLPENLDKSLATLPDAGRAVRSMRLIALSEKPRGVDTEDAREKRCM